VLRDDEQIDAALGRADSALYAAKRAGKNRVEFAAGESSDEGIAAAA
jgi:PleD family two-component response regulator